MGSDVKVGICTRYWRHEATFAAVRIGNWLKRNDYGVELFCMSPRQLPIDRYWDKRAIQFRKQLFSDWIINSKIDLVIFTHIPPIEVVDWLKIMGIPVMVFIIWHELELSDRGLLGSVACVLVPHRAGYDFLRSWGLRNIYHLPWGTDHPQVLKPKNHCIEHPHLFMPLYDGIANRMEMTALTVAERAILRCPKARLTIAYNSSTVTSAGKRRIAQIKAACPNRVSLLRGTPPPDRAILFRNHDLTLWPTEYESTCEVGLTSVTMGTPVLTFTAPPVREYFNERNAICVNSPLTFDNVLGLPRATPDYMMMDELLHQVLQDPDYLRSLQRSAHDGLVARQELFHDIMQQLI